MTFIEISKQMAYLVLKQLNYHVYCIENSLAPVTLPAPSAFRPGHRNASIHCLIEICIRGSLQLTSMTYITLLSGGAT